LAIHRKDEYAKSGVPMLPVTHGEFVTKVHIIVYTVMLVIVSVFPYFSGMSGLLYLASALVLGFGFLAWSGLLMFKPKATTAMDTFKYSIVYLTVLFVALVADHYLF
jgi:protoheme IX farnesyltransferase